MSEIYSNKYARRIEPDFNGGLIENKHIKGTLFIVKNNTQRNNQIPYESRTFDSTTTTLAYVSDDKKLYQLINNPGTDSTANTDWDEVELGQDGTLTPVGTWDPVNTPTLADSGATGRNGEFYFVENSSNPTNVNIAGLFGSVATDVYDGDWVVSIGTQWAVIRPSGTWATLPDIPTVITDYVNGTVISHTHAISDVTSLQTSLDAKIDISDIADHTISFASVPATDIISKNFLTTHYYTSTEVDGLIPNLTDLLDDINVVTNKTYSSDRIEERLAEIYADAIANSPGQVNASVGEKDGTFNGVSNVIVLDDLTDAILYVSVDGEVNLETDHYTVADSTTTEITMLETAANLDGLNYKVVYLKGIGALNETDPTVPAVVKAITAGNISNWDTAYGWGDHGAAGYITSESDPTVGSHIKAITSGNITNWTTAYNHYIQSASYSAGILTLDKFNTTDLTVDLSELDVKPTGLSFTDATRSLTLQLSDASSLSATITSEIPSQSGNNGKYLTTDGVNVSWATVSGGSTISGTAYRLAQFNSGGDNVEDSSIRSDVNGRIGLFVPTASNIGIKGSKSESDTLVEFENQDLTTGSVLRLLLNSSAANAQLLIDARKGATQVFTVRADGFSDMIDLGISNDLILYNQAGSGDQMLVVNNGGVVGSQAIPGGASTLSGLTDTTISSPVNNNWLKYNGSAWVNSNVFWDDVQSKPTFSTIATSGSYNDLLDKPTISGTSGRVAKFTSSTNIGNTLMYDDGTRMSIGGTPNVSRQDLLEIRHNSDSYAALQARNLGEGEAAVLYNASTTATHEVMSVQSLNHNSAGDELFVVYAGGRIAMYNLPSSATGLSSGMLWNDSGTLKIV